MLVLAYASQSSLRSLEAHTHVIVKLRNIPIHEIGYSFPLSFGFFIAIYVIYFKTSIKTSKFSL